MHEDDDDEPFEQGFVVPQARPNHAQANAQSGSIPPCPKCQSDCVDARHRARKTGGAIGAVAGTASGVSLSLSGAETGAAVGALRTCPYRVLSHRRCRDRRPHRRHGRLCDRLRARRGHRRQGAQQFPLPRMPACVQPPQTIYLISSFSLQQYSLHFSCICSASRRALRRLKELFMHLVKTMAYVGETPWHSLGNQLSLRQPIEVWARKAGMNWTFGSAEVRYVAGGTSNLGSIHAFPE